MRLPSLSCHNNAAVPDAPDEGRCILTRHGSVSLFNVYTPNGGQRPARLRLSAKMQFLSGLRDAMESEQRLGQTVVLVGDLNIAHGQADVYPSTENEGPFHGYSAAELQWMDSLVGPPQPFEALRRDAPPAGAAVAQPQPQAPEPHDTSQSSVVARAGVKIGNKALPGWLQGVTGQRPLVALTAPPLPPTDSSTPPRPKAARRAIEQSTPVHGGATPCVAYVDVFQRTNRTCSECAWRNGLGSYTCFDQRRSHRATNQGVRIDYVFCSVGTGSAAGDVRDAGRQTTEAPVAALCEIVQTPSSWSDHLLLRCELQGDAFTSAFVQKGGRGALPKRSAVSAADAGAAAQCPPAPAQGAVSQAAQKFLTAQRQKLHPARGSSSLMSFFKSRPKRG